MLTLTEINKAVNNVVETALARGGLNVPLVAEDVTEPIKRPSIKVGINGSKNGRQNSCCREKTLTVKVYFFASDLRKYKIENLKMQDVLENAFLDGLYIDGAYIPIEDVESDVTDTVLICSFDLYVVELATWRENIKPETGEEIIPGTGEAVEIMEKLEMKGELEC